MLPHSGPFGSLQGAFQPKVQTTSSEGFVLLLGESCVQSHVSEDFVAHDLTSTSAAQGWKRSSHRSVSILCTKQPAL